MIQFRNCPHCTKRIRVDATRCHRCQNSVSIWDPVTDDDQATDEHFASGAYANEDDFDYDQFLEDEFSNRPRHRKQIWYWVAWLMIALLLISTIATFTLD